MSDDKELIERVAQALTSDGGKLNTSWDLLSDVLKDSFRISARIAVAAVRAYDREQRAKVDAALAPKSDPDDYRDPLTLVTRMDRAPGIRGR